MNDLFDYQATLYTLLSPIAIDEKFALFDRFYSAFLAGRSQPNFSHPAVSFAVPSYSGFCRVVDLAAAKRRSPLNTIEGRRVLLHNLAHIEFSAIDLALDAAYRFSEMPRDFYADWLEVAAQEIAHFKMLRELLRGAGADYGDFEVHNGLFCAAAWADRAIDRMAIVPRGLEANGLDANLVLLGRVGAVRNIPEMGELLGALNIILKEEIDHVKKGDRWFKYLCGLSGLNPEKYYYDLLTENKMIPIKRAINYNARLSAGFSDRELKDIVVPLSF